MQQLLVASIAGYIHPAKLMRLLGELFPGQDYTVKACTAAFQLCQICLTISLGSI